MIPDPTRPSAEQVIEGRNRAAGCVHVWRLAEEPRSYPPPEGTLDYTCKLCGGKQRTTRVLGNCHYCSRFELLTRDHIVPRCRGGVDEDSNIIPACSDCNLIKGDDAPSCQCRRCRTAVTNHLAMIAAIRPFSPRWAEQLTAVFFNGRAPSRSGYPTPSKMGVS